MNRLRSIAPYLFAGFVLIAALVLAVAPFSRSLVEQWSRQDVELRARLAYTSTQGPIQRALADRDMQRLATLLQGIARDERILGAAVCNMPGNILAATDLMPRTFSCLQITRSSERSVPITIGDGRQLLLSKFPVATPEGQAYLVVLNDLTFIDLRSGQAQIFVVAALLGAAIIVAAIATVLIAIFMRGWMTSLRQALRETRTGRSPVISRSDNSALTAEIRKLLKDLQVGRTPVDTSNTDWTPQTLHDLLSTALPGAEVIIVSNREPYIHNLTPEGIELQTPASGLVSALEPVMRATGGTWIAHGSGSADRDTVDKDDRIDVPPAAPAYKLRRVWVSEDEQDGYYYGLANEGLWPLCHIAFVRPVFRESDWQAYKLINQRFADAVVHEATTEDPVVLVQDYHFALAPRMIRQKLPKATIITFWHIPWANAETFGIFPWKEEILDGLLGSSIIGFHTQFHCNNFFETADRFIESRIDREHSAVSLGGHETLVRPYPISIEWPPKALAQQPPVDACRARVRERLRMAPDHRIAVGIERFDYTKGILDRMQAIELLLSSHPEWKGQFSFIQVAAPTRSKLPTYAQLQREAIALAEEINAKHGAEGWEPIRLLIRHHEPAEVFELFRAADLCIVSSLHDGMNLVAKEFVAARDDDQGVLILSSFAGASREMSEALIVNPYDGQDMVKAIDTALHMSSSEQGERMRLMRQQVREKNVYRWAGGMLIDAARLRQTQRIVNISNAS